MSEDWTKRIFTDVPRDTTPPPGAEAIDKEFLEALQDAIISKLNTGEADLRYTNEDDLASTTDSAKGAALVGYKNSASTAVGRSVRLRLLDGPLFNVKDFGATGDGTTDDTAAIKLARDAFMAARRGSLFFPTGTYLITDTILFGDPTTHMTDDMTVCGDGATLTAGTGIAAKPLLHFRNNSIYNWTNFTISNLNLVGHSTGESELVLVEADAAPGNTYNFTIRDIHASNVYGHGIHLKTNVFQCHIERNHLIGVSSNTTKYGIYLENNHAQTTLYDNITYYFLYGVYTGQAADYNIIRGVHINAYQEGVYAKIQGGQIIGTHTEFSWVSAANQAAAGAGVTVEGYGDIYALSSRSADAASVTAGDKTRWGLRIYNYTRPINIHGWFRSGNYPFLQATGIAPAQVNAFGIPRAQVALGDTNTAINFVELASDVSADKGDASVTLTGLSESVQRFATTLTANRTVTLPTTGVYNGLRFRVVRTGLGAFTLDVGGLKTIPASTAAFVEVTHDGTAWRLSGYGTL